MATLHAMSGHFIVEYARGPSWEASRARRDQEGWPEHAAFMDAMVDSGFVLFGGPIGDIDGERALLVVAGASCDAVRAQLADDPWADGVLTIERVRPWTIWLGMLPDPNAGRSGAPGAPENGTCQAR